MSNESNKSYVQYTQLFNKVCSGPFFLVLAALVSAYAVVSAISFFGALGSVFAMALPGLNLLFAIVSTVACWLIFLGAKKGNIKPSLFKLATFSGKFVRTIANAVCGIVAFLSFIVAALVYTLADTLAEMLLWIGGTISDLGEAINVEVDVFSDFFTELAVALDDNAIMILIGCVVIFLLAILSMVRFSMGLGFVKNAHKTFTTGHMVAAPSMAIPVISFIIAAAGLYASCSILSFDPEGIVYSLIIAMMGVLILMNKKDLASIYAVWQKEIGMVSNDAAAAAAPAAPEAPAAEAPVAEAPAAEAPAAEEAPANDAE